MIDSMTRLPILPNSLALWGLGQMGFAIQGPDAVVYIDLCLSDYVAEQLGSWWDRAYPPPMPADQVTNARYYFISHEHWDHLDPTTVTQVAAASPQAHFLTNGWCREILLELGLPPNRVTALTALERTRLDETDLYMTAVPSAHYAKDFDAHKGYRWLGFLLDR